MNTCQAPVSRVYEHIHISKINTAAGVTLRFSCDEQIPRKDSNNVFVRLSILSDVPTLPVIYDLLVLLD